MAVVKVGTNYRVVYETKNLVSGIDNIFATIKKPDGNKIGPFQLVEEVIAELVGTYSIEIPIPSNAPIGEWTGLVISIDEGIKSGFRFSVTDLDGGGSGDGVCEDDVDLIIDTSEIDLNIQSVSDIDLIIDATTVTLSIDPVSEVQLSANTDGVELSIEEQIIDLEIGCEV